MKEQNNEELMQQIASLRNKAESNRKLVDYWKTKYSDQHTDFIKINQKHSEEINDLLGIQNKLTREIDEMQVEVSNWESRYARLFITVILMICGCLAVAIITLFAK